MKMPGCCEKRSEKQAGGFELVRIEKAKSVCPVCEEYAQRQKAKPVADSMQGG
jgi:hypothetical protein